MEIRNAIDTEINELAKLWYEEWKGSHIELLPADLVRYRTPESFRERMEEHLANTRVCGPVGDPLGFAITKQDEVYQLYVSAGARGKGVAQALIADAEYRLAARGVETAWLACAIGNERAARFYEKTGWTRKGVVANEIVLPDRTYDLDIWRYEKDLFTAR